MRKVTASEVILSLVPGAQFIVTGGDSYSGIQWIETYDGPKPTEQEFLDEKSRLEAEYDTTEYQRQRAAEYPDFREYLDGIVKGDQEQIQAYVDACLAVKAKYPKPGEPG